MKIPGIPYIQGRNAYTDGDGRKYGIAIHNTANDASARDEASYATRRTDGTSAHLYVDGAEVIQSLDTETKAGHAGSAAGNEHAIAVEITGTNGKSRDWWLHNVAWDSLGAALAYVITHDPDFQGFEVRRASVAEMRSNPRVRAFYGHDDMRLAWGGTTHTDPGGNFPWDRLFAAVNKHLGEDDMTPAEFKGLLENTMLLDPLDPTKTHSVADYIRHVRKDVRGELAPALTQLAAIRAGVEVDDADEAAIVAGVLASLTPEKIAAAIPAELAEQVVDALAERIAD